MGAVVGVAEHVAYRHEAVDGEVHAFASEVVSRAGWCRATIPDGLAPWADRLRDTAPFRGSVRLTRPCGAFAVTATSRGAVDAFVEAALAAMMACETVVERMLVFEVSTRAPGLRAWGRVMDRSTHRRGASSRTTWSDPPPGADREADALNAVCAPCADPAGKAAIPYAPDDARALRECVEAVEAASASAARFSARHRGAV